MSASMLLGEWSSIPRALVNRMIEEARHGGRPNRIIPD
ncbi:hypothetical protein Rumeso_04161 [Rubellimicrobium mesophilum DSM 19309]|uniref:Uncharacterized protein n=1 Tax=Rubellimicrobium mesophilum DSM 19309 TaxID=442562 RepID=A0A017HIE9_9RHOB|nr:hypothetical protein Rumeso_04161 [Rubellimicrobium mesophilum DSM 19309]